MVAIAIAIITCFTLVPIAAFAVDIGVQRVARRDVQAVADVVALDLARQLDGRTWSQLQRQPADAGQQERCPQLRRLGGPTVTPQLGKLDDASWTASNPDAYFTPITSDAGGVPNAVKVTARTTVNFSIHGGSGGVERTSIARSQSNTCFDVGSFALQPELGEVDAAEQPDQRLAEPQRDQLHRTGQRQRVAARSRRPSSGSASPAALMDLDNLSLNQFFLASAHALQSQGGDAADVTLLNSLATANLASLPHIKFSDLLELGSASDAAMSSTVNLLDLVSTAAFVANGNNALAVPSLTAGVGNVTNVVASLKVIQKPEGACGPIGTQVHTSQVDARRDLHHRERRDPGVLSAETKLTLSLSLADAVATLTSIQCGNPEGFDVSVASSLAQALSNAAHRPEADRPADRDRRRLAGHARRRRPRNTVQFRQPAGQLRHPEEHRLRRGAVQRDVTTADVVLLGVLPLGITKGGIVGELLSKILTPVVNPLIANTNSILVGPLADLLGLNLGGADIIPVPPTVCNDVKMAG